MLLQIYFCKIKAMNKTPSIALVSTRFTKKYQNKACLFTGPITLFSIKLKFLPSTLHNVSFYCLYRDNTVFRMHF